MPMNPPAYSDINRVLSRYKDQQISEIPQMTPYSDTLMSKVDAAQQLVAKLKDNAVSGSKTVGNFVSDQAGKLMDLLSPAGETSRNVSPRFPSRAVEVPLNGTNTDMGNVDLGEIALDKLRRGGNYIADKGNSALESLSRGSKSLIDFLHSPGNAQTSPGATGLSEYGGPSMTPALQPTVDKSMRSWAEENPKTETILGAKKYVEDLAGEMGTNVKRFGSSFMSGIAPGWDKAPTEAATQAAAPAAAAAKAVSAPVSAPTAPPSASGWSDYAMPALGTGAAGLAAYLLYNKYKNKDKDKSASVKEAGGMRDAVMDSANKEISRVGDVVKKLSPGPSSPSWGQNFKQNLRSDSLTGYVNPVAWASTEIPRWMGWLNGDQVPSYAEAHGWSDFNPASADINIGNINQDKVREVAVNAPKRIMDSANKALADYAEKHPILSALDNFDPIKTVKDNAMPLGLGAGALASYLLYNRMNNKKEEPTQVAQEQ